jgi:hypothetical protein
MPNRLRPSTLVYRCTACGTTIWSDYVRPQGAELPAAPPHLDDRAALAPDVHIFTRTKLPWVQLPPDVPPVEVYYDMEKLWPAGELGAAQGAGCAR